MMSSPTAEQQNVMNVNAHTVVIVPATDDQTRHVWKGINIDMGFVKGINGILVAAEMILSMAGLISMTIPKHIGCVYLYGNTYSYFTFLSVALLASSTIQYLLFMLAIPKKANCRPWIVGEVIIYGLYCLHYALASTMVAWSSCWQGGYKAAAGFGFACVAALIGHVVYHVRQYRESRPQPAPVYTSASSPAFNMSDLAKPPKH